MKVKLDSQTGTAIVRQYYISVFWRKRNLWLRYVTNLQGYYALRISGMYHAERLLEICVDNRPENPPED